MKATPGPTTRARVARMTAKALHRSGALALARWLGLSRSRLPILQYHSVSGSGNYRAPSLAVSPRLFERQMAYLAAHYRVVSLDEVVDCIERRRPFPPRAVAITFDDGYLDNYLVALPVLVKHHLTATFFLTAGPVVRRERFWVAWLRHAITRARDLSGLFRVGLVPARPVSDSLHREGIIEHLTAAANRMDRAGRNGLLDRVAEALSAPEPGVVEPAVMLEAEHVRAMSGAGMTIGSHTLSHANLPSLDAEEAFEELAGSKALLETACGQPVKHLAYPGGPDPGRPIYSHETVALVRRAGYRSASLSHHEAVSLGSDPFALGRYHVDDWQGFSGFALRLEQPGLSRIGRGGGRSAPTEPPIGLYEVAAP